MVSAGTMLFFLGVLIGALTAGGIAYDIRCWRKMFGDAVWHEADEKPESDRKILCRNEVGHYWIYKSLEGYEMIAKGNKVFKWTYLDEVVKYIK